MWDGFPIIAKYLKILPRIRSVLTNNKLGLLLESFEMEYKILYGSVVPYKALGFPSTYDLLASCPARWSGWRS